MFKKTTCRIFVAAIIFSSVFAAHVNAKDACVCAGCKTEYYLIEHVLKDFEPQAEFKYKTAKTGNKKAVELLLSGKIDFAFTCKSHGKLAKKFKLAADKVASWESITIARDPIVVVAHPSCGVGNLTRKQLCSIFDGSVTNWKAVGGKDLAIKTGVLDSSVESGVVTVFKETTVGKDAALNAGAVSLKSPSQLGNFCKVTHGAVVFMGMNSYKEKYGALLNIDGIEPNVDNIVSNDYPIAVTYHILLDRNNDRAARDLLKYMASPEGVGKINEVMVAIEQKAAN